jgi:RNA polymerase-interacting CarD/CdnL/TRCF family regulator
MPARSKTPKKSTPSEKWSQHVTETSNAMDIEAGTFASGDPVQIAHAVEKDAESSNRRKSSPYRSAMSMLTFYINRAGKNLAPKQRKVLEDAKDVLREEFGPAAKPKKAAPRKKTTTRSRG